MNPFLEACGANAPLRITVEPPGAPTRDVYSFELPFFLLGRDPRCDLRLDHPEVSDRHAYVQLVAGRLLVKDLGSVGGITQAGKRLRLGFLATDPPTRVGPYRLRLIAGCLGPDAPDEPTADEPPEALLARAEDQADADSPPDRLLLDLRHRSVRKARCAVQGDLALVGSGTDCAVRFLDPGVSETHAALVLTRLGVWVVDLLGKNGVRVNGQEVSHARLFRGDEVRIGTSTLNVAELPRAQRDLGRLGAARMTPRATPTPPEPPSIAVPAAEPLLAEPTAAAPPPPTPDPAAIPRSWLEAVRLAVAEALTEHRRDDEARLLEELEQARRLTRELQSLRDELARQVEALGRAPAAANGSGATRRPEGRPVNAPLPVRLPRETRPGEAPPRPHDEALHLLLSGRMSRLQEEPRSGWRKLLDLVSRPPEGNPAE